MRFRGLKAKPVYSTGGVVQVNGITGESEATLQGGERIFSREDTKAIISLSAKAVDQEGLVRLGKKVYDAIKLQDKRKPQYTDE